MKYKRNDPMCDPRDSQGDEKMQFLFLLQQKQKLHLFFPLGISRVAHWIISFMLHISAITSPTN